MVIIMAMVILMVQIKVMAKCNGNVEVITVMVKCNGNDKM